MKQQALILEWDREKRAPMHSVTLDRSRLGGIIVIDMRLRLTFCDAVGRRFTA